MVTKRFTHVRGGRWFLAPAPAASPSVHPRAREAMGVHVENDDARQRFTHVRGRRWSTS